MCSRIKENRMILVGAGERNLGKTSLITQLISHLKDRGKKVIAVKVVTIREAGGSCPRGEHSCGMCGHLDGCSEIRRETERFGEKDTMVFLNSGADEVFLVRTYKHALADTMKKFLSGVPEDAILICESNSVGTVVEPAVFLMLRRSGGHLKPSAAAVFSRADIIIDISRDAENDGKGSAREKGWKMEKIVVHKEYCKSCGYCVKYCPRNVLEIGNKVNQKGYEYVVPARIDDCISCCICGRVCPDGAIDIYK